MMQYIFPLIVLLTGLMAGLHFANVIGYLPALGQADAEHVMPFWKNADEYFSRRMPVFGGVLLACLVLAIYLMRKETDSTFFWLLFSGLMLILIDLVITIKINTPANEIIRTWQGGLPPPNFESIRAQILAAFYGRAVASILSFVLTIIAYISWHTRLY